MRYEITLLITLLCISTFTEIAVAAQGQAVEVMTKRPFGIQLSRDTDCGKVKPFDKIDLSISGMDTGLRPLGCDPTTNSLTFVLERDYALVSPANNAAWRLLMGKPFHALSSNFVRILPYVVQRQEADGTVRVLDNGNLKLTLMRPGHALIGGLLVFGLWGFLVILGRQSGMLRDAGNPGLTLQDRTYSLARAQMAWWFAIILGSYIFLWVMTDGIPPLSSQALLMMGVSGATGLASIGLDASKTGPRPAGSGKFLDDLLTDADGVTLHRFQMLAMTVILGVIFLTQVVTDLTMPTFDGSLLSLFGIAGGTYIGFKFPEQQVAPNATQPTAPAPSSASPEDPKAGYTPEPSLSEGQ